MIIVGASLLALALNAFPEEAAAACPEAEECDWMQNFHKDLPLFFYSRHHATAHPGDGYFGVSGGPWPAINAHSWVEAGYVMESHSCCIDDCGGANQQPEGGLPPFGDA